MERAARFTRLCIVTFAPLLLSVAPAATGAAEPAQLDRITAAWHALITQQAADPLPENSDSAIAARHDAMDDLLAQLLAIPTATLVHADLVTFGMLRETLEAERGVRICRRELWGPDHIAGWHIRLGTAAKEQISPEELSAYIDREIGHLKAGLESGYSAPQSVVRRVIAQVGALETARVEHAVGLHRYRQFLEDVYLPRARRALGVNALPNGDACYRALLRRETTLDTSPREIFERGEKMLEGNRAAIVEIGRAVFRSDDYDEILRRLANDPANKFGSAAEVLDFSRQIAQRARERSASWFFQLPSAELTIVGFPESMRGSGMNPYYSPAKANQPARYLVNLETWRDNSRGQAEVATIHEAWPGHHLQVSVATSLAGGSKLAADPAYPAYIEGWARYVERLADEQGLYTTPYARIAWRAKPGLGMVVDPGLHAFGWTNERAANFLAASGLFPSRQLVEDMLDRIAVMPAQLTAYDTGGSEFLQLRDAARAALGADFDLRAFHSQVLGMGFVPLTILREQTLAWIGRERHR